MNVPSSLVGHRRRPECARGPPACSITSNAAPPIGCPCALSRRPGSSQRSVGEARVIRALAEANLGRLARAGPIRLRRLLARRSKLAPLVPGPGSAPSESFDGCFVVIVPS